jgi:glucose/mannose transport system substrate-binding protein
MVPLFADVGVQLVKGEAAGNIHGDWLQGDLQVLGGVPGENYECLPALGLGDQLSGGGDSFFFPKLPEGTDPAVLEAQTQLAKIVIGKEAQLAFNLKKGSMPIRTDIDLSKANPCMNKALALLKNGLLPTGDLNLTSDTQAQMQDLSIEFINDKSISLEDYINRYADILATAQ